MSRRRSLSEYMEAVRSSETLVAAARKLGLASDSSLCAMARRYPELQRLLDERTPRLGSRPGFQRHPEAFVIEVLDRSRTILEASVALGYTSDNALISRGKRSQAVADAMERVRARRAAAEALRRDERERARAAQRAREEARDAALADARRRWENLAADTPAPSAATRRFIFEFKDLVRGTDIANIVGVSRQRVSQLKKELAL